MSVATRRKLIEAAQALAKTNAPTIEHYQALLLAVAQLYTADTDMECECVIRETQGEGPAND